MMLADTLPRLLRRNAASMGARPAMREKRHGIWQTLSWSDYEALVLRFARGLAAHGFRAGDRLAVLGDNRPRLYAALLAAQSLGGAGVPLWPDAEPDAIAAVVRDAGVRVVVAEDQEQIGKLAVIKPLVPGLALVVSLDPRAARGGGAGWIEDFATIDEAGRVDDGPLDGIAAGRPDDVALLLYRTGQPGVKLTHGNLLAAAHALASVEEIVPTDDIVAFLPMAWIGDVLYALTLGLSIGFTCNCPESPETARRDLREIGPSILAAPPSVWEAWLADVEDRTAHASRVKRAALAWARRGAERPGRHALADWLVFGALRDQLGLSRLRWAHTGGSLLEPEVWRAFRGFGVNLKQSYGPAEAAGLFALQAADATEADTALHPVPGVEIRLAPDGEVLVRGSAVCGAAPDGWWYSGDAGELTADGRLVIHGRQSSIARLADGTRLLPQIIESRMRRSRFIADALACGDGQPFVAALIAPDRAVLAAWAESQLLPARSLADLVGLPQARALIREELRVCNADLPPALRVRRFMLLSDAAEAETVEAKLDRALQRQSAMARHGALIATLFCTAAHATEVPGASAAAGWVETVEDRADPGLAPAHA